MSSKQTDDTPDIDVFDPSNQPFGGIIRFILEHEHCPLTHRQSLRYEATYDLPTITVDRLSQYQLDEWFEFAQYALGNVTSISYEYDTESRLGELKIRFNPDDKHIEWVDRYEEFTRTEIENSHCRSCESPTASDE